MIVHVSVVGLSAMVNISSSKRKAAYLLLPLRTPTKSSVAGKALPFHATVHVPLVVALKPDKEKSIPLREPVAASHL